MALLARNDNACFSGRKQEVNEIILSFRSNSRGKKLIYCIYGESGIGKSSICRYIAEDSSLQNIYNIIVIDFNLQSERSIIDIISTIINAFFDGFQNTNEILRKYFTSIDANKPQLLKDTIDAFISEVNVLAYQKLILVILDTIEVVQNSTEWEDIEAIITKTNECICFMCSGKLCIEKDYITNSIEILGFNIAEIVDYFYTRNPSLRRELKKNNTFLPERIKEFTNGGHPILCGLVSDWLLSCPEQLDFLLDNNRAVSEKQLISWIADIDAVNKCVLQYMAYFSKRMDSEIIGALCELKEVVCQDIIKVIGSYSFVKYYSEDGNLIMHDIVASLISTHLPLDETMLSVAFSKIIHVYNAKIQEASRLYSQTQVSYLRVEKAYYTVLYSAEREAINFLDNELSLCLEIFDFNLYNMLISVVWSSKLPTTSDNWNRMLEVAEIDLLVAQCKPQCAIDLIRNIKLCDEYQSDIVFRAKVDEAYARCIINPCTIEGLDLNEATELFTKCAEIYKSNSILYRLARSYIGLGNSYVRVGQSNLASQAFEDAESTCTNDLQKISILLERSKMLRLQQRVAESLTPLLECETVMNVMSVNRGKYYYYMGNTLRDLNKFALAEQKYEAALEALESTGADNNTLCELYIDYSWMEYLRSEHANFHKVYRLLNLGWEIAEKYQFGTEYSEYYHILYEIERDNGEYNKAFKDLDTASMYANTYSNIYMILDCLNHKVQQHYHQGTTDEIPNVINLMKGIEDKGCGIRVFRGRAKLVQGDVYFDREEYLQAFDEYKEGFTIVALYGDSRSNVELFQDLFYGKPSEDKLSRKDKLLTILSCLKDTMKRKLKTYWYNARVDKKFDYFIDELCIR